jgi:antitoxin StbD
MWNAIICLQSQKEKRTDIMAARANEIMNSLVPITQFNRGQASRIFDRIQSERRLIVLKNNQPEAVILSPAEYERLSEIEENYYLLSEAQARVEKSGDKPTVTDAEVMKELGIKEEEIRAASAAGDIKTG